MLFLSLMLSLLPACTGETEDADHACECTACEDAMEACESSTEEGTDEHEECEAEAQAACEETS